MKVQRHEGLNETRNIELVSSWLRGNFFDPAIILIATDVISCGGDMDAQIVEASTTEQRVKMSYDDFQLSVNETHAEWVNGEVIFFMPPKTVHQRIVTFLTTLMSLYARFFVLGETLSAPFEMRAKPDGNAREPDILFVANEHRERLTDRRLEGPADLIVEVISTESVGRDRGDKFYEYQEAGVREYWIIDPRPGKQRIDVWWLTDEGQYQAIVPNAEGRYISTILPGFWISPAWLWQEPPPETLLVLAEMRGVSAQAAQQIRDLLTGT